MGGQQQTWWWIIAALWVLGSPVWAADEAPPPERQGRGYRMKEVTVTAQQGERPAGFLPDVAGTKVYAGKKTAVVDLQAVPPIINNNYRQALAKTPGPVLSEETTP